MYTAYIDFIRAELPKYANPENAVAQMAYLKTTERMLGMTLPQLRSIVGAGVRECVPTQIDEAELLETARELWDSANSRDERRAAIFLLSAPRSLRVLSTNAMPLINHMVRTGAWWDLVDSLIKVQPSIRSRSPEESDALMREWAVDEDFWIRRYAIISQLGAKSELSKSLLADVITPNLDDREFFVAKAIGWALRDHARHDPDWVFRFVSEHPEMQPLSRREALKHFPSV